MRLGLGAVWASVVEIGALSGISRFQPWLEVLIYSSTLRPVRLSGQPLSFEMPFAKIKLTVPDVLPPDIFDLCLRYTKSDTLGTTEVVP